MQAVKGQAVGFMAEVFLGKQGFMIDTEGLCLRVGLF